MGTVYPSRDDLIYADGFVQTVFLNMCLCTIWELMFSASLFHLTLCIMVICI